MKLLLLMVLSIALYACSGAPFSELNTPLDASNDKTDANADEDAKDEKLGMPGPDGSNEHDAVADTAIETTPCGCSACCGIQCATMHTNGLGQTWQDCVPLGTYNQVEATKACDAADAGTCGPTYCIAAGENVIYVYLDGGCAQWGYGPALHGLVHNGPLVSGQCVCPSLGDLTWQ